MLGLESLEIGRCHPHFVPSPIAIDAMVDNFAMLMEPGGARPIADRQLEVITAVIFGQDSREPFLEQRDTRRRRRRSERVERSFAHVCDTGGGRRSWVRGLENVRKHYLVKAAAHNLGLILRKLLGTGKPRAYGALGALLQLLQLAQITLQRFLRIAYAAKLYTRHSRIMLRL